MFEGRLRTRANDPLCLEIALYSGFSRVQTSSGRNVVVVVCALSAGS